VAQARLIAPAGAGGWDAPWVAPGAGFAVTIAISVVFSGLVALTLSPALAAEIRAIGDPDTTMPVLIPIDRAFGQPVRVQGVAGLGIGDNTGVGGVVPGLDTVNE